VGPILVCGTVVDCETDLGRYPGLCTPVRILGPGLGQVQLPIDQDLLWPVFIDREPDAVWLGVLGQGSEAGSPKGAKWSGPMNEVISAICSPRRVSTLIDQLRCAPASSFQR